MVGTKENLQSRIAKCASHIMRDASFSINEVKGALGEDKGEGEGWGYS